MNSQMFNSFWMAQVCFGDGCNLKWYGTQSTRGWSLFSTRGMDDLAHILRPRSVGGQLEDSGIVELSPQWNVTDALSTKTSAGASTS